MLPILLILLGAGITAYSVSPTVKTRLDEFVRAIKGADVAHKEADANMNRANEMSVAALQAAQGAASLAQQAFQAATSWATFAPAQPSVQPSAQPASQPVAAVDPWAPQPSPQPAVALDPVKAQDTINRAVDFLADAKKANQAAAGETGSAALNAETKDQRQAATQSANKVLERDRQITEMLNALGVGECDVRTYQRITPQAKDALLAKLHAAGMSVTGNNPYDIDTGEHDVKLRAVWDVRSNELKLIVSARGTIFLVPIPCSEIWKRIEPKLNEVVGSWRSWR